MTFHSIRLIIRYYLYYFYITNVKKLDLFIRNAEKQGANGDLIQSANSVKDMLSALLM
jgi:hypothetical protein